MRIGFVRSPGFIPVATMFGFLLMIATDCLEQSVAVKVRNDGSSLLHVRSSAMPAPFAKANEEKGRHKGVRQYLLDDLLKELGPGVSVRTNEVLQIITSDIAIAEYCAQVQKKERIILVGMKSIGG